MLKESQRISLLSLLAGCSCLENVRLSEVRYCFKKNPNIYIFHEFCAGYELLTGPFHLLQSSSSNMLVN